MRLSPNHIISLIFTTIFLVCCQHDIINISSVITHDTVYVVTPPLVAPGGGTPPAVSDTVCFNTEVLPLYVSYCGSSNNQNCKWPVH